MEKRQRTRLATAGILALVFTTGALVGVAVDRIADPDTIVAGATRDRKPAEEATDADRERQRRPSMYTQVGLTPDRVQIADSLVRLRRAAYRRVYETYREDVDSVAEESGLEREFRRRADSLVVETRRAIRALMTPEQVARYDSLLVKAESERRRSERERRPDDRRN